MRYVCSLFRKIFNKFIRHADRSAAVNTRGNVAVITALAMLPMIAAVGCVVDYTTATMIKTKLQAAADAASLAIGLHQFTRHRHRQEHERQRRCYRRLDLTQPIFSTANLTTSPENTGYSSLTPTATVTKNGMKLTSTVSFTRSVPTTFMGIAGYKNVAVSGTSTASLHACRPISISI